MTESPPRRGTQLREVEPDQLILEIWMYYESDRHIADAANVDLLVIEVNEELN